MAKSDRRVPDWISGFLKYTEDTNEAPQSFREWVAVSVLCAALKRKCHLNWGHMTFYPNMYVVLVAPSGKARKGTAMGPGMSLLSSLGIKLAAESITREALVRELRDCNETHTEGTKVLNHCSLTIYSQELTVFLGYNNAQLMADLADWYDCRDMWTYRTKTQGEDVITGVFVNLIGATTPELLQTTLPRDAIGGGLTSRIVFIFEEKKGKVIANPFLTPSDIELYSDLIYDLEKIHMMKGEFKVTTKFMDMWVDWYERQEGHPPFDDDRFSGYIERRPTHILKLCQVLSASMSDNMVITHGILKRAITLLEKTEVNMPRTFRGVGNYDYVGIQDRVMTLVSGIRVITFKALFGKMYFDIDKAGLEDVVKSLEEIGFLKTKITDLGMIIERTF